MNKLSIQYCSDLHLEFPENEKFLMDNPIIPKAEILLLAGDIVPFKVMDNYNWFWDKIANDFNQVYWVPGNHEYYHDNLKKYSDCLNKNIRKNICIVNNYAVVVKNVRFIFSTLWSHIRTQNQWMVEKRLSDFHLIKNGEYAFTTDSYNKFHKQSVEFITGELKKGDKAIVCSHHVPTFLHYPEEYKGDILNDAFATELFSLIEEYKASAWIFGHHHRNCPPFLIGETQMLTNQLGYVRNNEHEQFNTSIGIKI